MEIPTDGFKGHIVSALLSMVPGTGQYGRVKFEALAPLAESGHKHNRLLQIGDLMKLEIEKIGALQNKKSNMPTNQENNRYRCS